MMYQQQAMDTSTTSDIGELYENASVFITGGSGFIGKLLVSKLFLSCPRIKMVYLLLRPKKGVDPQQRANELFNDIVYSKLRVEVPDFQQRLTVVSGDCSLPNLGLSDEHESMLVNNVNVILHVAATVRFNEHFKTAINTNVASVYSIVSLAKKMDKLKSYVHVSTVYSNCNRKVIEEKLYDFPFDYKELIELAKTKDEKYVEDIKEKYLGDLPNTYVFTKAAAEQVLLKEAGNLPVAIFRPSIILSTIREPIPGWTDNVYGPTGLVLGCTLGCIKVINCDEECTTDLVPADMVVNALIAVSWETYRSYQDRCKLTVPRMADDDDDDRINGDLHLVTKKKQDDAEDVEVEGKDEEATETTTAGHGEKTVARVYNFVSSSQNPITWHKYASYLYSLIVKNGSEKGILYPSAIFLQPRLYLYRILIVLLHFIPAFFIDFYFKRTGSKIRLSNEYHKLDQLSDVLRYFSTSQWTINDANIIQLWNRLSPQDKSMYPFDIKQIDWNDYLEIYLYGVRKYLIKESMDAKKAKQRIRRLYQYHVLMKTVFYSFFIFCTSCIIRLMI